MIPFLTMNTTNLVRIIFLRFIGYGAFLTVLSGCITTPPYPDEQLQAIQNSDKTALLCRKALAIIEHTISENGHQDAGAQYVATGF